MLSGILLTYPYPNARLLKDFLHDINATHTCDQMWCETARTITMEQYVLGALLCAIALLTSSLANTVLFSRVLGTTQQGTMQGIYIGTGEIAKTLSPVAFSYTFERYGMEISWLVPIILLCLATVLTIFTYRWLLPNEPDFEAEHLLPDEDRSYGTLKMSVSTSTLVR